jgi:hypothetical protein
MKSITLSLIVMLGLIALASFTSNKRTYQTECISIQSDGSVAFKIWDTKKGDKYTPEQSRKDALHAILYSGIIGGAGCSTQPPILDETEEQENFKTIEKSFFSKTGKWSMFTRNSSTQTTLPSSIGDENWKVYQVSVSKNELRKYLEEQKIIKPLNNGF